MILQPKGISQSCQIYLLNRIEKNITEPRNFFTQINRNGLETKQMILQFKVNVKVIIFLFNHRVGDQYSLKKTRNFITTINRY